MPEPHLIDEGKSRVGRPLTQEQVNGIRRSEGKRPVEVISAERQLPADFPVTVIPREPITENLIGPRGVCGEIARLIEVYDADTVRAALDFLCSPPSEGDSDGWGMDDKDLLLTASVPEGQTEYDALAETAEDV